ncbi:microtubule-associated tumor suppressor candidate 2 homolog [Chanos chanos]|uniref:Microtubule-associated tumor suppressor candidate 2 homolog n=1 Tax=Chanos chanos TaxID=29144 RepID=A0A6J2WXH8_CHACN|nr:microtubule-associated tumor suppressor candidate 2 homolog [Chanos chanos]
MNLQGEVQDPQDNRRGEIKNNNKTALLAPDGDANANQIPIQGPHTEERGTEGGSPLPPLVPQNEAQDSSIIWGTHSQCDDPELEEFELLECQELEAFIVEKKRGKNCENPRDGTMKDLLLDGQSVPASTYVAPSLKRRDQNDNHSTEGQDPEENVQPLDLRTTVSQSGRRRGLRETRSGSESNVFVSCLSTVPNLSGSLASALDSAGRSQPLSAISQSIQPTSARGRGQQSAPDHSVFPVERSREQSSYVDQNHNSTTLPQELGPPQHDRSRPLKRASHRDGSMQLTSENGSPPNGQGIKDQRSSKLPARTDYEQDKQGNGMSFELRKSLERVLPCRRQLVQPFSPETGQGLHSGQVYMETQSGCRPSYPSEIGYNISSPQSALKEPLNIDSNHQFASKGSGTLSCQPSGREAQSIRRQGARDRTASPSSLERRTQLSHRPCGSPTRAPTPPCPKATGSPRKHPPFSPVKTLNTRTPQLGYGSVSQGYGTGLRTPVKTTLNSNIQKPLLQQGPNEKSPPPKCPPKPKSVRPKIITYVRKSPQTKPQSLDGPYEVSSLPSRLSNTYTSTQAPKTGGDPGTTAILSASNLLYDKYRQEMQKGRLFSSPGLVASGIKPPSHTMPHKLTSRADSFYGSLNKYQPAMTSRSPGSFGNQGQVPGAENPSGPQTGTRGTEGLFRPQRALRPQLGLGAVTRAPSTAAKNRVQLTGQKSPLTFSQPVEAVNPSTQSHQQPSDQRKTTPGLATKSQLTKPAQTGLRPPGFTRLPPPRLAAFGFVRSSSVSSVSSNHSIDSTRSDPCRPAYRPGSVGEDPPFHRVATHSSTDGPRTLCRTNPLPPNTPAPVRRSLLPPAQASAGTSCKEFQKNPDVSRPAVSSPKRLAVVSPKPQSPVLQRHRAPVSVRCQGNALGHGVERSGSPGRGSQARLDKQKEKEQQEQQEEVLLLQGRCEEQAKQLQLLQAELRKTTLGLEALALCTQHFCLKNENAVEREKELTSELSRIRDEVATNTARWERLQKERADLEQKFERELKDLQVQQEAELAALEEDLRARHAADKDHLKAEHQSEVEELRTQQQEQIEELTINHESALEDLRTMHNITMATMQEEHARTMRDLRRAHEQQKASLEQDFEKLRLSLQDQVDTLTFQNRSLRDKAKRFEEALRKSTDEQIVDALAPYQHIEEDLKSLKEVLDMKNQQIHDQEKKISELEKMQAQKNVYLEEQVQVLQQQNEDLKARVDRNLALSRQLSEENANLQVYVERESNEKKRLSRNNEELLWRLQTGDLSPRMSPSSSPIHRAFFADQDIPPYPYSPSPSTPTHCYSPGPCNTPPHRSVSPGPGTPPHRNSPARASPARTPNANTLPR